MLTQDLEDSSRLQQKYEFVKQKITANFWIVRTRFSCPNKLGLRYCKIDQYPLEAHD